MLTNGTAHHNGIHLTSGYLPCASDYEPRPAIDVTPKPAVPGWRSRWPEYTHNVSWVDSDSKQHSLTIRTDDLDELLATLTAIKNVIRASKAKTAETTAQPAESQPDVQHCHLHGVDMPRRWSKRTNGHYFGHKLPDGCFCYGRAKP
jgi:hypothetical protein